MQATCLWLGVCCLCRRRKTLAQEDPAALQRKARWTLTFKVGRVEQAFKRVCLRKELIDKPEFAKYRTREHTIMNHKGTLQQSAAACAENAPPQRGAVKVAASMKEYVKGKQEK